MPRADDTSQPPAIPCRMTLAPGDATPAQLQAWQRLWRTLLGEDGRNPERPITQDGGEKDAPKE
jgi:hypothetical protein